MYCTRFDISLCNDINKHDTICKYIFNIQRKIIDLIIRRNDTRTFSILTEDDEVPVFVHLTFKKLLGKYVVSCLNGSCKANKGHTQIEYWSS